ncbi:lipase chaperone [Nocardia nova]|uniref:Lipase chaperone n=1 Tax=Nocardia nova TaxID=37330 RepID=A0A2S6ACU3_9NOCA|nr:lipase chaperone [Nocardia nova]PPJ31906.1 lipase chaperone [Nocardia nova]
MSDYILTASRFDQVLERYDDGRPKKVVKHRRGDTVTGLSDSEVARLTAAGAIAPKGEAQAKADDPAPSDPAPPVPTNPPTPVAQPTPPPGADEPVMPAKTAKTDEWQAYAVKRGMDKAEAASKSRAELIEIYAEQS